jgi:hypothetical protein
MLTVKQLLLITPGKVRYRASYPRVRIVEDKPTKQYRRIYSRLALGNTESTGDSYTQTIRCHGTKKNPTDYIIQPHSEVWVHCSCPYFTYYLEVVLQLHGSSRIYNSNGEMPKIRNPRLRPYLCKHLYALMLYLMAKDKKKK